MKNVLLYCVLFIAITLKGYSQNLQNANWYFGDNAAVTFLPDINNPVSIPGSQLMGFFSSNSVSDQNGQLQFYTNGATVWNKNHVVMTNGTGLLNNDYYSINSLIIPRPGHNGYYIINISYTNGLNYSEVDLTDGTGFVVEATKNQVLYDHNNVPINAAYQNLSRKLTSTLHSNGTDYWLLTQINGYIYSYLVTSAGISSTPASITQAIVNTNYAYAGAGHMKISPDTQRIGICYSGPSPVVGMSLGNFDNTTGLVTLDPELVTVENSIHFLSIEFSPNSQYVYFSTSGYINHTIARSSIATATEENDESVSIYRMPSGNSSDTARRPQNGFELVGSVINKNTTANKTHTTLTTSSVDPVSDAFFFNHFLQLGINGKIYLCVYFENNVTSYLSIISNPDNYTNPGFLLDNMPINYGHTRAALPQWVPWQTSDGGSTNQCLGNNIVLSTTDAHPSHYTYKYSDYIKTVTNYTVNNPQNITFKAGNYITMDANTYIAPGSLFLAKIEDCDLYYSPSSSQIITSTSYSSNNENDLLVYPNPASDNVTIAVNTGTLKHIIITALDGKVIYDRNVVDEQNSSTLNTSTYSKGMYIITIQTSDGKTISSKLMVN